MFGNGREGEGNLVPDNAFSNSLVLKVTALRRKGLEVKASCEC
jgi:hypothetical protein